MKQKDIALFLVVGIVSAIFSVGLSNFVISPSNKKQLEAEKVDAITADFDIPATDNKYFNPNAINPTKLIEIGDNPNVTPFNGTTN